MKKIPFWSYESEYNFLKKKIFKEIDQTLLKKNIFFGKTLDNFEKNFLNINNSKYGLAVKSGTDALILSLICSGIKKDDEVITSSLTAIPTVSAIVSVGAKPVFIDVNEDGLIDVSKIKNKINKKTKAIIPVHLYGKSCQMDNILKIKKKYKIKIIEDCAQSFLAKFKGRNVGNFGDFSCYSFYPTKILGAYGDGGFIICKTKKDLNMLYKLRFYGLETYNKKSKYFGKYHSIIHGTNSRLDNIQATILNIKLNYIKKWIKKRQQIAKKYIQKLNINEKFNKDHVYHLFVIKEKKRKEMIKFLNLQGIGYGIHYSKPIHKMKAYSKYVCKKCDCLKNSEKLSKEVISIPMYPYLQNNQLFRVIKIIKKFRQK